jgi:hypothetical protein
MPLDGVIVMALIVGALLAELIMVISVTPELTKLSVVPCSWAPKYAVYTPSVAYVCDIDGLVCHPDTVPSPQYHWYFNVDASSTADPNTDIGVLTNPEKVDERPVMVGAWLLVGDSCM